MIHPVDVPVLFTERRQYTDENADEVTPLRKNAYGQCVTNKISQRVLPQVVLQRGLTLWGSLFKETSRFPINREEKGKGVHDRKEWDGIIVTIKR
ncbi:hypothetical protein TTRE_0000200301 [Trichuris trichiura]|uniref:Uncharacterized protein n=1 Tax=Trichuris trichiura TaxID=36087 RepID=A0A077Z218_TRITR|nr:hypothetical protein TTRE_0000200301 [Trichuris trichiura]